MEVVLAQPRALNYVESLQSRFQTRVSGSCPQDLWPVPGLSHCISSTLRASCQGHQGLYDVSCEDQRGGSAGASSVSARLSGTGALPFGRKSVRSQHGALYHRVFAVQSQTFKCDNVNQDMGPRCEDAGVGPVLVSDSRQVKGLSVMSSPSAASSSGIRGASVPGMVECLEIQGGVKLSGHVRVSGAKNSALAVLAGAICCEAPLVLQMVPDLHDIRRMFQVLQSVGVKVSRGHDGLASSVLIDASNLTSVEPSPEAVRKLRASFFVIGALVGRKGEAVVPLPGGCNIGARPIDLHMRGLEALGADVKIKQGKVHARARNGKLVGGTFFLEYPSVGATETLMMAACLAEGESTLSNVAQEPEVVDLAEFLISCGAKIKGAGTNCITVQGVPKLHGTAFTIIPDRIEAGTLLIAAAMTRSTISMSPIVPRHLMSVIATLRAIGCEIHQTTPNSLKVSARGVLQSCNVKTMPYPGFPTDCQPQLMSLLTTCNGASMVEETVFESRMRHVEELQKMGAQIKVTGSTALISGRDIGSELTGVPVTATDLRAGAALVLAGMAADGLTHIEGVSHLDRGYEHLDDKLRSLGAIIARRPCLPAELNL